MKRIYVNFFRFYCEFCYFICTTNHMLRIHSQRKRGNCITGSIFELNVKTDLFYRLCGGVFFKLKLPLALVCGHCYFRSILGLKKEKSKWERLKCPHSLSSIDSLQSFAGHKERAARASVSCIWRARQATVSCGGRLHEHQAGALGNTLARASGLHGQQMGRRGIRRGVRILYSSEQNEESCSNNYSKIRGEAQPSALILYQISVVQHLAVL
jgi:hypothetical protein